MFNIFMWSLDGANRALMLALFFSLQASTLQAYCTNELAEKDNMPITSSNSSDKTSTAAQVALARIALQKQYVPMYVDGKLLAYKAAYFGQMYAGTPPKPFTVIFDSGSGHVILPSSTCYSSACRKHRRFIRAASKTAIDIDADGTVIKPDATERDQVGITFGTGEVLGEFVRDVVCFSEDANTCVDTRIVLAVEMAEEPFGLFDFDGVLGLGLSSLALEPEFSFFGQLIKQRPEMKAQFAVFLAPYDGGESLISFGGYDETRTTSEVKWVEVVDPDQGHWQVPIKRVRFGETILEECEDGTCRAILDSGTSLLGVPRRSLRTIHRNLARPVGKEYPQVISQIDCRTIPGLQMHFELGDGIISLGVEDYARPSPWNLSFPEAPEGWKLICRSLLLPTDMEAPFSPMTFIFGEPVLRRYYSVFDVAEKKIGFSRAREMPEGTQGLPVLGAPPPGTQISGVGMPPPKKQPPVVDGGATL